MTFTVGDSMGRLYAFLLILLFCAAPGASYADSRPHDNLEFPKPPATSAVVGSPTNGMFKWLNGQTGPISGLNVHDATVYTNRIGVLIDKCTVVANGCTGEIPANGSIKNTSFTLNAPATGSNLPVAVSIINGHNIVLDGVSSHHFFMAPSSGYGNGDNFSTERGNAALGTGAYNITYRNTWADGATDGNYDFKGDAVVFDNARGNDGDICIRAWGHGSGISTFWCQRWGPSSRGSAFQVIKLPGSNGTKGYLNLSVAHVEATPGTIQKFANLHYTGATLIIGKCWGPMPANDGKNKLVTYEDGATPANTTLQLGPGCRLGDNYPDPAAATAPPAIDPPPVVAAPIPLFWPSTVALVDKTPGDGKLTISTTANWHALGARGPVTVNTPPVPCAGPKGAPGLCYTMAQ